MMVYASDISKLGYALFFEVAAEWGDQRRSDLRPFLIAEYLCPASWGPKWLLHPGHRPSEPSEVAKDAPELPGGCQGLILLMIVLEGTWFDADSCLEYIDFMPSEETSNLLIGYWSLASYENFLSSGTSVLISEGQQGSLEYTKDGTVRVSIQRDGKQLKALGLSSRLENIQYEGRYEIDVANHSILHRIEKCNEPERVGKVMVRQYALLGDRLEIIGVGLDGKVTLTWTRVR